MEMETITSRSAEHQVYGPNLDSMMGQNQIMGQNQTSDPTTWVNRTPPNKNKSLLVGHVTVGGSPRLQVRISALICFLCLFNALKLSNFFFQIVVGNKKLIKNF